MFSTNLLCLLYLLLALIMEFMLCVRSTPIRSFEHIGNSIEEQPEDVLIDLITRYGQTIMRARDDLENSKRTVDFGLSRGYSGAQEAKHRMAMAVANFAGGPGRKRKVDIRNIKD
ncbi:diuretic hormone class 2 [Culex quinquefasciatus]|uniref:Diuretic hormone class 2 n=3 Tax=Culex pipiens TaxID=7175 RepID=A0A8D8MMM7_CULPI|nr:diuretic hormone class 2 [Culex quinquefasciatus]XP_038107697.1 diuretic hormone class 2 [Culex quinquefasciatus]